MVILYLLAIVAANLSVAYFGPPAVIINAFLFIGCDLVSRDSLHDRWHGRHLPLRMAALIATGSVLSWLLNRNAGPIALASFVAFAAAATVDTLVYTLLRRQSYFVRVNGSNIPAAITDSALFLYLAFGPSAMALMPLQVLAKIGGGVIWSYALARRRRTVTS
jgi:hypothetical protein